MSTFKLSLAEPKYLKDSIAIISELVTEASFKITQNSIELVAMDPANVAMVIFKLLSSAFSEYKVDKEEEIAINLNNFKAILRRAKPTDILTMELVENKLIIQLKGTTTRTFHLPIIDIEERQQKIPELTFPVSVQTSSSIITEAIEDVDVVGESVSFIAEPEKFTISAEGDMNKVNIEIPKDETTTINAKSADKVKAKYSVEYLKKMIAGSKLSPDVVVQFNKDYPLKLEFKSVDKCFLSFILAPRVDND